jgi:hypothetical protein
MGSNLSKIDNRMKASKYGNIHVPSKWVTEDVLKEIRSRGWKIEPCAEVSGIMDPGFRVYR